MDNSNVVAPVVMFHGNLPVEVQERTSRKSGNRYEVLVLKSAVRGDIVLSLDRALINDVKVYLLSEDI